MFGKLFKKKETQPIEKDLLILTSRFCRHPMRYEGNKCILPFKFMAVVDLKTNVVSEKEGYVFYEFPKDAELEMRTRDEYINPAQIEDEVGTFRWNRDYKTYEGTVDWLGVPCQVVLHGDKTSEPTLALQALQRFKRIYNSRVACDENLRAYGRRKLEEQYKENLADAMTLTSISIFWDGQFEFHFNCEGSLKLDISYFEEIKQYGSRVYDSLNFNPMECPEMVFEKL